MVYFARTRRSSTVSTSMLAVRVARESCRRSDSRWRRAISVVESTGGSDTVTTTLIFLVSSFATSLVYHGQDHGSIPMVTAWPTR